MTDRAPSSSPVPPAVWVAAGEDRFAESRSLGVSTIAFKVVPHDRQGLLILENTFHTRGGPARHLHDDQDEWFYVLEGEFLMEVGDVQRAGPTTAALMVALTHDVRLLKTQTGRSWRLFPPHMPCIRGACPSRTYLPAPF